MSETKKTYKEDGYKPLEKGYQPKNDFANNGFQPAKQTSQPAPPPKKP